MHSKLRRLARLQQLAERYRQLRKDELQKSQDFGITAAYQNVLTLAALVLHGEPKLEEPLEFAWERYLKTALSLESAEERWYRTKDLSQSEISIEDNKKRVIWLLEELPGNCDREKFQHVLNVAPHWLLKFMFAEFTANILGLKCPDLSHTPPDGRNAVYQRLRWPACPDGKLQDGGPLKKRRLTDEEQAAADAQADEWLCQNGLMYMLPIPPSLRRLFRTRLFDPAPGRGVIGRVRQG